MSQSELLKRHLIDTMAFKNPYAVVLSITLTQVNVQKQIPLTSIQRIDYEENANPVGFKLVFKKSEMLLEARHQESCKQWVDKITEGIYIF